MFEEKTSFRNIVGIRIGLFILFFFFVAWLPWWFALAGTFLLILFKGFYEGVFIGILLDSVYKNQEGLFLMHDFIFTIILLVAASFSLAIFRQIENK